MDTSTISNDLAEPQNESVLAQGCPNCGAAVESQGASVCPKCGFECSESAFDEEEENARLQSLKNAQRQTFMPMWAIVLIAGITFIFIETSVIDLVLLPTDKRRAIWTFMQTLIGCILAGTAHMSAFMLAASKGTNYSPFDMLFQPIELWKPTIRRLPETARHLWLLGWGLTAILCATCFIGGVEYEAAFDDWGVDKSKSMYTK